MAFVKLPTAFDEDQTVDAGVPDTDPNVLAVELGPFVVIVVLLVLVLVPALTLPLLVELTPPVAVGDGVDVMQNSQNSFMVSSLTCRKWLSMSVARYAAGSWLCNMGRYILSFSRSSVQVVATQSSM